MKLNYDAKNKVYKEGNAVLRKIGRKAFRNKVAGVESLLGNQAIAQEERLREQWYIFEDKGVVRQLLEQLLGDEYVISGDKGEHLRLTKVWYAWSRKMQYESHILVQKIGEEYHLRTYNHEYFRRNDAKTLYGWKHAPIRDYAVGIQNLNGTRWFKLEEETTMTNIKDEAFKDIDDYTLVLEYEKHDNVFLLGFKTVQDAVKYVEDNQSELNLVKDYQGWHVLHGEKLVMNKERLQQLMEEKEEEEMERLYEVMEEVKGLEGLAAGHNIGKEDKKEEKAVGEVPSELEMLAAFTKQNLKEAEKVTGRSYTKQSKGGEKKMTKQTSATKVQAVLFTDGSYTTKVQGVSGWAFAAVHPTKKGKNSPHNKVFAVNSGVTKTTSRQVAGELRAVVEAIKWAKKKGATNVVVAYDFEGIRNWVTGDWKSKSEVAQMYRRWMYANCKGMKVSFKKIPAHSGNVFNNLVDDMAKDAIKKATVKG